MNVGSRATESVRVGRILRRAGRHLMVPLMVTAGVRGFAAQVHYDATQLRAVGVRPVGGSRGALVQANFRTPGVVNVAAASTQALPGGQALVIEFAVKSRRASPASVRLRSAAVAR